ncbi:MAG: hypothetical protein MUC29_07775 [Pyrinomonadaceae bacterium]|jgi:hypothetical protein|nr:hypothetical protein [Pyrinomonadaceae bacterium]
MFPHWFDRYNILLLILNSLCESQQISPKRIEELTNLSQPTISNVLNYTRSEKLAKANNHRPFTNSTLKKILNVFCLENIQKDALAWLLQDDSTNHLRKTILEMLDEIAKTDTLQTKIKQIEVEISGTKGLFDSESAKNIFNSQSESLQKRLHLMSSKPGHRMVVSKFPTSATHPDNADERLPVEGKLRKKNFIFNISKDGYGERHIHSTLTINRYLDENSKCSLLDISQRRKHIEILIKTLKNKKNVNFKIGLADKEPEIELAMRSLDVVGIRTTAREVLLAKNPFACGPSFIFFHDKMTVLSCYLDFEREWESISTEFKEKEFVINWLEESLSKSVEKKRRKDDILDD